MQYIYRVSSSALYGAMRTTLTTTTTTTTNACRVWPITTEGAVQVMRNASTRQISPSVCQSNLCMWLLLLLLGPPATGKAALRAAAE